MPIEEEVDDEDSSLEQRASPSSNMDLHEGISSFQLKPVLNGAIGNGNDDKDKEVRKRGRRPRHSTENSA